MVIDVFSYNGEKDMLMLHVDMLAPYVDEFVIVEATKTFSGFSKPLYFERHKKFIRKHVGKIKYFIIDENDNELWELAYRSPNTRGANHWLREFVQKESIKKALSHVKDNDVVYIGDVDEIWDASFTKDKPIEKIRLKTYAYYLDNRSSEEFWGTVVARWGDIKDRVLNHVRSDISLRGEKYGGWHFTSMGGIAEVRRKLDNSYTAESYNTYEVQEHLQERVRKGIDYLGRPFHFTLDESEWPKYLKENRSTFAHLCKGYSFSPHGQPTRA